MLKQLLTLCLICSIASTVIGDDSTCWVQKGHPDYYSVTNCSNPETGCPAGYFSFQDGHCDWYCSQPFIARREGSSAYCDNPYPTDSPTVYPNGSFSNTSCDSTKYFTLDNFVHEKYFRNCIEYPANCWVRKTDDNSLESQTNCSNPDHGCPESQFLFEDGSCSPYCHEPFIARRKGNSSYCDTSSCEYPAYIYPNGSCSTISCDPEEFDITGSEILKYCTPKPTTPTCWIQKGYPDYYSITNCSNLETGCPPGYFSFQDGHCDWYCNQPFYARREGSSAYCDTPYPSPCGPPNYVLPDGSCSTTSCDPTKYFQYTMNNIHEVDITFCSEWHVYCWVRKLASDSHVSETNCSNPDHGCPESHFLFEDGSCSPYCHEPLVARRQGNSSYCDSSCLPGFYRDPNGTCVESSVNIQVYMRYNIPLDDFNRNSGSSKFVLKLTSLIGVDSSAIQILNIREGSTIIEAQIPVPLEQNSGEDPRDKAIEKAKAMMERLSAVVNNNGLVILETGSVLDFKFSIQGSGLNSGSGLALSPSLVNVPEQSSESFETSESSSLTLGLSVGLGVLVLFVAVAGFLIYRKRRAHQLQKVIQSQEAIGKTNEECKDNKITGQPDQVSSPNPEVPGPENKQTELDRAEITVGISN